MAGRIDAETRRKANLRVLQRIDSNIVDLAITATHVVLYEFNNAKQRWEKKNVEGWLALTKRSEAPRFKLIVLNRSSTENLEVPITASFQMQVKEPYMIFRDSKASSGSGSGSGSGSSNNGGAADESIRGIWFHDGNERDQIASYLEQVVKSLVKIEEMERNHAPTTTEALVDTNDDDDEEAARQDAGAALLSTLTLGSANNDESTMSVTSAAFQQPDRQGHAVPVSGQQQQQQHAATTTTTSSTHQNLVLDKKSLQLSLLSLIQDERFLDLIHAQYLKVVHTRAARQQQQQPQQQSQPKENNGTNM